VKALDTNIVARFVVGDDQAQAAAAAAILQTPCYLTDTVMLETAWLLSSRFGVSRAALATILLDLVYLPTVTVSDLDGVEWAIGRFAAGADFADMLHIHAARGVDSFVSFEKRLPHLAGPDTPVRIETLG